MLSIISSDVHIPIFLDAGADSSKFAEADNNADSTKCTDAGRYLCRFLNINKIAIYNTVGTLCNYCHLIHFLYGLFVFACQNTSAYIFKRKAFLFIKPFRLA